MDDETYVLSKFSQLPGQAFYVSKKRGDVKEQFRTQKNQNSQKDLWCGRQSAAAVSGVQVSLHKA